MEVHLTPELAKKLEDHAATTGRALDEIVQDALAGYLEEVAWTASEDAAATWDAFVRAGRRLERRSRPGVSSVRLLSAMRR